MIKKIFELVTFLGLVAGFETTWLHIWMSDGMWCNVVEFFRNLLTIEWL